MARNTTKCSKCALRDDLVILGAIGTECPIHGAMPHYRPLRFQTDENGRYLPLRFERYEPTESDIAFRIATMNAFNK